MSVRIAIVPFDGDSTTDVSVSASEEGVEIDIENAITPPEQIFIGTLSPPAAKMFAQALLVAADEAIQLEKSARQTELDVQMEEFRRMGLESVGLQQTALDQHREAIDAIKSPRPIPVTATRKEPPKSS